MAPRLAGLLLHPTSLPDEPGGLVASARALFDWMQTAGLTVWQILPIGPPGPGGSPYSSPSAFAGSPSFRLPDAGDGGGADQAHAPWLDDWCLFAALRETKGAPWTGWDPPVRRREPSALAAAARELAASVERHRAAQTAFFAAWRSVRDDARARGIAILGDVPIYPALDSADVWSHQDLFRLDADGRPETVAGVPPDYFSEDGQLWGNPLYRWDRMHEQGYAWWIARLRHALSLHDRLRLDHFRGFSGYWAVPGGAPTAREGRWEPGPGTPLFDALRGALGGLPFVAEDLGVITDDVVQLRRALGIPGTRVLQFAFDGHADNPYLPHNYVPNTVVYTGTHDNPTTRGWYEDLPDGERGNLWSYLKRAAGTGAEAAPALLHLAWSSVAALAVAPLQDVLNLGREARMNQPGSVQGNWRWRATDDMVSASALESLRGLTLASSRTEPTMAAAS